MRTKPDKHTLTDLMIEIIKQYPPEISTLGYVHNNLRMAFLGLIEEYPEIVTHKEFLSIYISGKMPWQMADDLLKPKRRNRERGDGQEDRMLLNVHNILNNPEAVTDNYGVSIDRRTFHRLLRTADNLRTHGKPLDEYLADLSDKEKICIAESLGCCYEMYILFRTKLYKKYQDKAKTVKKIPELEEYYSDAHKLATTAKGGKQITKTSIEQDIQDFKDYLTCENIPRRPIKELYDVKRFRYLADLVIELAKFFSEEPENVGRKEIRKNKNTGSGFSIDQYLDDLTSQPRKNYGVLLLTFPPLDCETTVIT